MENIQKSDSVWPPAGACVLNSSLEWILMNLGGFSQFATVQEMYLLNPEFNAVSTVDQRSYSCSSYTHRYLGSVVLPTFHHTYFWTPVSPSWRFSMPWLWTRQLRSSLKTCLTFQIKTSSLTSCLSTHWHHRAWASSFLSSSSSSQRWTGFRIFCIID